MYVLNVYSPRLLSCFATISLNMSSRGKSRLYTMYTMMYTQMHAFMHAHMPIHRDGPRKKVKSDL